MNLFLNDLNLVWYQWKRNNWLIYFPRIIYNFKTVLIDRPIFLVGNQGDGLTLVSRILRRHPQVVSITGNHTYWSGADEMQKVMMCRLPPSLRLGGRFFCPDIPHPIFTPPRSWSYASDDLIQYYRRSAADFEEKATDQFRNIIKETLFRYGDGGHGNRFVDKSQVFSVKMSYVDALLKDTNPYFVLISRNPYVTCYRAALGKAGDMRRYAKYISLDDRLQVCIQHWTNSMRCIFEDKDKVSNFISLRFEDFLQNPKDSLLALCSFLDLSFDQEMFPAANQTVPFGSKYRDRWYPLRPDVNKPYLAEIPQKYIDMIAESCQPLAERLGYQIPEVR